MRRIENQKTRLSVHCVLFAVISQELNFDQFGRNVYRLNRHVLQYSECPKALKTVMYTPCTFAEGVVDQHEKRATNTSTTKRGVVGVFFLLRVDFFCQKTQNFMGKPKARQSKKTDTPPASAQPTNQ